MVNGHVVRQGEETVRMTWNVWRWMDGVERNVREMGQRREDGENRHKWGRRIKTNDPKLGILVQKCLITTGMMHDVSDKHAELFTKVLLRWKTAFL